ncbi:pyrimidine utilization protein D [Alteromonas sp. a30]|nr:pyrimidine utilization protein D [Alteromonas sp. a30]
MASINVPTVLLSSGLGGSANFWQPQIAALSEQYRVIVYDQRGTGRSPFTLPQDYSIDHMAQDVLALMQKLEIEACHFIGHALGGLVGLHLALHHPEKLESLVPINAWSCPNPHTLRCFDIRKSLLAHCSASDYLKMQALLLYPPDWIAKHVHTLEQEERHMLAHFPDKANLLARIKALSEFNIDDALASIQTRTFVLANSDDTLIPWKCSQSLARRLPNSSISVLDYGGHASTITVPEIVNNLLLAHLQQPTLD